jgi:hypothetical protein
MPDRIELANVHDIRYEPNMSSCLTGAGTITICSSHSEMPEIKMKVGHAQAIYSSLTEACTHRNQCLEVSFTSLCICLCAFNTFADSAGLA